MPKNYGIILAAGQGVRLASEVPPFHKPLLVMDGRSLIKSSVHQFTGGDFDKVIVVVAPQNAQQIIAVCGSSPHYVVQTEANGPAHALNTALFGLEPDANIVVLMGDNLYAEQEAPTALSLLHTLDANVVVGIKQVDADQGERFTRLLKSHEGNKFVASVEGPYGAIEKARTEHQVWCGPFATTVGTWRAAYLEAIKNEEDARLIGPTFTYMLKIDAYASTATDIGIPELLP